MELMFIDSILRSPSFPPHDAWLSGYAISYYYFGYVLTAMLAKLSPTLAKKLEGMQADRQQYDEAPRDPEGALDKPSETTTVSGQTRGPGPAPNGARPNAR